jgi:hypothetical protein
MTALTSSERTKCSYYHGHPGCAKESRETGCWAGVRQEPLEAEIADLGEVSGALSV